MEKKNMSRLKRGNRRITASETSSMPTGARGFSLVELLVTVAIIMITAAIVGPAVKNSYDVYQFRSAVASTSGAIRSARYQAIAQGSSYRLVFDSVAATYQLQKSA